MGFIWGVLTSKEGQKEEKAGNIHIRCEKYFLSGNNVSTIPESI